MKFQNLSVKRLFSRVAIGLVLSMSGITIALFLVTKQTAVLLTGGALLLCALVGIFVLTQAFGKRLSQFTADLCQTLDHMIAGNEAPQRPEDSETQLARIGHRLARLYQIMQENRRRVDEERQELQTLVSVSYTHLDVYKRQDNHIAGSRGVQPAHHVKQGGLAAAGGSHNGHKLAVLHREVHAVKGAGDIRLCAVILFQINRL